MGAIVLVVLIGSAGLLAAVLLGGGESDGSQTVDALVDTEQGDSVSTTDAAAATNSSIEPPTSSSGVSTSTPARPSSTAAPATAAPTTPTPTTPATTRAPTTTAAPTTAAPTTTTPTTSAPDCHPAYQGCLSNLPGDALNCGDIPASQRPVILKNVDVDPYKLDGNDRDGRGCEG